MNMTTLLSNILPVTSLQLRLKTYKYRIPLFDKPRFQEYLKYERTWHKNGKKIKSVTDISKKIDEFFNEVIIPIYKIKPKVIRKSESQEICDELDKVITKLERFDPKEDDFNDDIEPHLLWIINNWLSDFFDDQSLDRSIKRTLEKEKKISEALEESPGNRDLKEKSKRISSLLDYYGNKIRPTDILKNKREFKEKIESGINSLKQGELAKKEELITNLNELKKMIINDELTCRKLEQALYRKLKNYFKLTERKKRGQPPKRFNVLIFHLGNQFTFVRYNRKGKSIGWVRRDWELMVFILLLIHFTRYKIPEISSFLKRHQRESEEEIWKKFRDMAKKEYNNFCRSGKGKFGRNYKRFIRTMGYDPYNGLNPWLDYPK